MTGQEREGIAAFLLRHRGRVPAAVLAAFEQTPRGAFLPGQFSDIAWTEGVLPVECGEVIESADLQALAITALDAEPESRVLEIGTGTGFTAAVLSRLANRVVTMERYRTLAGLARGRLEGLGISNVVVRQADGSVGLAAEGPFDRIVVWASFDSHPRLFVEQLSSHGVMVTAIGPPEGAQTLVRLSKLGSRFDREDLATVRFQPLIRGVAAKL